jgi:hypothetical protein
MPNKQEYKLDINYVENIIQQILNKAHTVPEKKIIKRYPNNQNPTKLNFACPICGDSHTKMSLRRGHLFFSNLFFVCYNERESDSMSFTRLCKHFGIEIDPQKKMDMYQYLDQNWTYSKKDDFALQNLDKLIDIEFFMKHIADHPTYLLNVKPIEKYSAQWRYLTERKIFNFTNVMQGNYKLSDKWTEPVIVMLNRAGDKLLSIQLRNLKAQKEKRIYKFIDFQECYNMIHSEPLDEVEAVGYNKLSAVFNFFNVDLDREVYVFEGFLDSLFFPNAIALVGLDTDISMFSEERVNMKFVLDNDTAGQKKAKQMIDKNNSVFLWRRLINDLSKGKSVKFKSTLEDNCKDINTLAQFYGDPNIYYTLNLDKYFAKDQFDLIDM